MSNLAIRRMRLYELVAGGEDLAGEGVTLINFKSRYAFLRILERFVNPSDPTVADLTDWHNPNRREQPSQPA